MKNFKEPSQKYFLIKRKREIMSDLILEGQGRIMPFYAVDPRPPDPVESVKKAIESQGFVGVKLYPPMGYKPIGNDDR